MFGLLSRFRKDPDQAPRATDRSRSGARVTARPVEKLEREQVLQTLDNPALELDDQPEGFDPYNSGAFDRRRAWKQVRRR